MRMSSLNIKSRFVYLEHCVLLNTISLDKWWTVTCGLVCFVVLLRALHRRFSFALDTAGVPWVSFQHDSYDLHDA